MSGHRHVGCCCSDHNEFVDSSQAANLFSLYSKIDTYKVQCFNEAEKDSGRLVFKPWEERLDRTKFVESDVDQELLFVIPFTGSVKLRGMIIIGGEDEQHPKVVKLFKNRPNMMFDDAVGMTPDQELELARDSDGTVEYELKTTRFNSVTDLCIYIPENFGADKSRVYYIGLRGDFTEFRRQEIPVATYEARANPADHHRVNLLDGVPRHIH